MNLSQSDFMILIGMLIAVIAMSFIFPALGLGGEKVQESEIPEYDIATDRFDFAGDFPERPHTPTEGVLNFESGNADIDTRDLWLDRPQSSVGSDGTQISTFDDFDTATNDSFVQIVTFVDGDVTDQENHTFSEVGEQVSLSSGNFTVVFELLEEENKGLSNYSTRVSYDVREQPGGTHWSERIPVLGGAIGAGEQLASTLGWGITVFFWIATYIVTIVANVFSVLVGLTIFILEFVVFLATTYSGIISDAPSWAGIIVAIPGTVLSVILAKIVFIILEITWLG